MANWWESAPKATAEGNWWESSKTVGGTAPKPSAITAAPAAPIAQVAPAEDTITFMAGGGRGPTGLRTIPRADLEKYRGRTVAQGLTEIPQKLDDMVRDLASQATFGAIDKFAAGADSLIKGSPYEEEIKRQRKQTAEASKRIGPIASGLNTISSGLGLGALTKGISPLQQFGPAAYEKLGRFGGSLANAGLGALEGSVWGATAAAAQTDDPKKMRENIEQGAKYGALLGSATQVGSDLLSAAVSPIKKALSPQQEKLIGILKKENIPLTAGQETGSKMLSSAEKLAQTLPGGERFLRANPEAQATAYNRAVLSKAGIDADVATPEVLQDAANMFGQQYTSIAAKNTLNVDKKLIDDLNAVTQKYGKKIPSQQRPVLEAFVNDIRRTRNIPGETYLDARSTARRIAKSSQDPMLSDAFRDVRDAIDSAFERSIPAGSRDAEVLRELNKNYANFKIIDDAMSSRTEAQALGNIIPQDLSSAIRSRNKAALSRGQTEIADLARAGTAIFKAPPQARTEASQAISQITQLGMAAAPYALGGALYYNENLSLPMTAGLLLSGAALTNPATQAYLRNQLGRSINTPAITSAVTRMAPNLGLLSAEEDRR